MTITNYGELKTAAANWLERDDMSSRIPEWIGMCEDRLALDLRIRSMETRTALIINQTVDAGTASGTNTIVLTPATAATAYLLGDTYTFEVANNTTAGAATVNISGLGAKSLFVREGDTNRNPEADELKDGTDVYIYYDGTQFLLTPQAGIPLPSRYLSVRDLHIAGTNRGLEFVESTQFWKRQNISTGFSPSGQQTNQPSYYTIEGNFILFSSPPDATYVGWLVYYRRFATFSSDSDTNWLLTNARNLHLYGALLEAAIFLENDKDILKYGALYEDLVERVKMSDERDRIPPHARARVGGITP